jgi:hypothetical protein
MPRSNFVRVPAPRLRQMFNDGRYYERFLAGELLALVGDDRHPSAPAAREPNCTRSQIVHYYDVQLREKVAIVHQYVRPDGSLGASGRPDPKRIKDGDTIYSLALPPRRGG